MRVCRLLVLLLAAAAVTACARQPSRPYYAASYPPPYPPPSAMRSDLDVMMYGAPAPYRQPRTAYRPAYAPPAGYRPAYAPPSNYAPSAYRQYPGYGPPPTAYRPVPPPSYPVRHATQYVPVRALPEDNGPYTLDTGDKLRIVVFGQDTLEQHLHRRCRRPGHHAADRRSRGARHHHRRALRFDQGQPRGRLHPRAERRGRGRNLPAVLRARRGDVSRASIPTCPT